MKVRDWIEALERLDPEQEVRAMNLLGEWVRVVPVAGTPVRRLPMRLAPADPPEGEFVKLVREGDQNPQPWARW